jgi:hypothetical protein
MLYAIIAVLVLVLAYVIYINYKDHVAVEFQDYKDFLVSFYNRDLPNDIYREIIKPIGTALLCAAFVLAAPVLGAILGVLKVIVDVHNLRK